MADSTARLARTPSLTDDDGIAIALAEFLETLELVEQADVADGEFLAVFMAEEKLVGRESQNCGELHAGLK